MECLYRLFMFMSIINGAKSLTNLCVALEDVPVLRFVCSSAQICLFQCSDLFVELYAHICFSFGVTSTDLPSHGTEIARLDKSSLP